MAKAAPSTGPRVSPRIRVYLGKEIALGPGKVELLRLIAETGSLSEAARRMKMSYMRAWTMVKVMNQCFREPLLAMERGGATGGGARLTECGQKALALYDAMEARSQEAMEKDWEEMLRVLRKG